MSPNPPRDTEAGRAYNDLRNLAKARGRDPAEYLALYVLEGFLVRLAGSTYAHDFVLKGGVLLAAFAARRPTRDIDLAAPGSSNDVADVERCVGEVLTVDVTDGVEFDPRSIHSEIIRDEANYTGVRVHLLAALAKARVQIHIDVNFGDPIWPSPQRTTLPRILGGELSLLGYPVQMLLAEKIITAIDRGAANTRWRDFVDVVSVSRVQTIAREDLAGAIQAVADHRGVEVRTVADAVVGLGESARRRWGAWRRKQRLTDSTPESLTTLLDEVIEFADPVLSGATCGPFWHPTTRTWST